MYTIVFKKYDDIAVENTKNVFFSLILEAYTYIIRDI